MSSSPAQQSRRDAVRKAAAIRAAAKLFAAQEAVGAFLRACNACQDGSGDEKTGIADGRHRLIGDMAEYATYLEAVFGKGR